MNFDASAQPGTLVVAIVGSPEEAREALAAGADMLAASGPGPAEELRAACPRAPWWAGEAPLADCDAGAGSLAAIVAAAAISAWQGAPAVGTRHVQAVRRAVDMAATIRGDRQPARTVRGLA